MNIRKETEKKFRFLTDSGFSCTFIRESRLFAQFEFRKDSWRIVLTHDVLNVTLDLMIKQETKMLFESNYDRVMINHNDWKRQDFSDALSEIYSAPHTTNADSNKRLAGLLDLYADWIVLFLNSQA